MIKLSNRIISTLMVVLMLIGTCISGFSVFAAENTVYNIDFEKPHTIDLHGFDGTVRTITLKPQEMKRIKPPSKE